MNIRLRNLIALGRDMDQELQRLYLLQSLPPSWENVSQTLSLQKTLTTKDIEAEFIVEGQRQAARGVVPIALLAQTNFASGSMATMGKRKRKGKGKAKVQQKKKGRCFICGKPGHFCADCLDKNKNKKGENGQHNMVPHRNKDYIDMITESMMVDTNESNWSIDSGATRHISRTKAGFIEFQELKAREHNIYMGNETFCDVLGMGKVKIPLPTGKSLYLSDVFFAPGMRMSVISVSQLASSGFEIRFTTDKVTIRLNGKICISGLLHDKLYLLDTSEVTMKSSSNYYVCVNECVNGLALLWHYRL